MKDLVFDSEGWKSELKCHLMTGCGQIKTLSDFTHTAADKTKSKSQISGQSVAHNFRCSFKPGQFYVNVNCGIYKIFSAIWLLPEYWVYGDWPRSGEIDIIEIIGAYA